MIYTFLDLPWFVRYSVYEYVFNNTSTKLIISCHDGGRFVIRGTSAHPMYHALSLVSKTIASECKTALLKTSSVSMASLRDLSIVSEALPPEQLATVRSVTLEVVNHYTSEAILLENRTSPCTEITYASIKAMFPNLKYLEINQDPGSVKLHSQIEFTMLAEHFSTHKQSVYLSDGWGHLTNVERLSGSAYALMGNSVVAWLRQMIEAAREDGIRMDVRVRFRCAADPRLQLQEMIGTFNIYTKTLVVEHSGARWTFPQDSWFLQ